MAEDDRHDSVLDTLLDLQAKLRGDDLTRRLERVSVRPEFAEVPEPEPTNEPVSVRQDDLEVSEDAVPSDADRLEALSERLKRVEHELAQAMDRLRVAEIRYVDGEEPPETVRTDRDRDVYRRVQELQELASRRPNHRRH